MLFIELFMIAVGLSMDAFAVSVCKGLSIKCLSVQSPIIVGLYFGIFQAIMPLVGYLVGIQFQQAAALLSHWIAFGLLTLIGFSMMKEAVNQEEERCSGSLNIREMTMLAIATSIDAMAVGVTFAFLEVTIFPAIILIGLTTFILSIIGVKVGNIFGVKYKNKAEFAGGAILMLIGTKILFEHVFFS